MTNEYKRIVWFGDSWTTGVSSSIVEFPATVSQNLNLEYINFGVGGSGYQDIEEQFAEKYHLLTDSDVVVFCLTSMYRQKLYTNNGKAQRGSWKYQIESPTSFEKIWNVEIANDYYCSYLAFKTINLLYYMCIAKNITCFFVNAFSYILDNDSNLTPQEVWLLDYKQSLADDFFEIREPEPVIFDVNRVTVSIWNKHKEKINKFLIPNDNHPNQIGNNYIAEKLINILQLKLYGTR